MKITKTLAIAAFAIVSMAAFAQTPAKDALSAIKTATSNIHTAAEYKAAQDNAKGIAEQALKNVDPASIDPKDAYDYAQLYDRLGDHKIVCDLVHKYLSTNPGADDKFDAQMLMMQSCNALNEGGMLEDSLHVTTPNTARQASLLASYANGEFLETIEKTKGLKDALHTLDDVQGKMIYDDPAKVAPERLENYKKMLARSNADKPDYKMPSDEELLPKLQKQIDTQNTRSQFGFVEEKANLYSIANQQKKAVATIDAFIKEHPNYAAATTSRNYYMLKGNVAPALQFDREYGDFKSLGDLKGKVVIVDFFAHWCGPCKASFPDVRKMYDDLHSKGLEIVAVTGYQGYYGQPSNKMAPADEYAKMADFVKEHNMDWPVIFSPDANHGAFNKDYGVSGIPTSILIGRDGKVIATEIGYDPDQFKDWRAKVEKALGGS
ncbi:MAG TPA: TlpA disulfide reductase family protein [Fimbriimonadaceae bacterium]|jgi:thiol-disulfide isomerase/thioredoxin